MLGTEAHAELRRTPLRTDRPHSVSLRAWLVARSRFAEDALAAAVAEGATQYVLLGAGLDTFALRNPHAGLRVFEVDHPATQVWKRDLLSAAGLLDSFSAAFVPVDFETDRLAERLATAGFDSRAKTMFGWLGVVPYLTLMSFRATLRLIADAPAGSGVVLDYGQPRSALPPLEQLERDSLMDRVQRAGEPFQLFFTPEQMAGELARFRIVEDLGGEALNARYFAGRSDALRVVGTAGRLVRALV